MKQQPKTIQIFLPDGNPRSVKIAEITSRTVQATLIPRSKIDEAAKRKELSGVGVYYLFGENEEWAKFQYLHDRSADEMKNGLISWRYSTSPGPPVLRKS